MEKEISQLKSLREKVISLASPSQDNMLDCITYTKNFIEILSKLNQRTFEMECTYKNLLSYWELSEGKQLENNSLLEDFIKDFEDDSSNAIRRLEN